MNTELMKSIELIEALLILILILGKKISNVISRHVSIRMIKNSKFNEIFNISLDNDLDINIISNNCKWYITQKEVDKIVVCYSIAKFNKNYNDFFKDNKIENKSVELNSSLSVNIIENNSCYNLYQELLSCFYESILRNTNNNIFLIHDKVIQLYNEFLIKFEEAMND
ncbi:hypothetical protein BFS06_13985 [Clostridium perfringens]|uniref:Uncharacterized protein n=1 Tax=Clostridium perfringens TaxID=1502 RepID=A0A140GRM0_CLOPF|nr:hypothetical protein [Clostridium perfringens]AMN31179.1 hypothetical protein JFP838_pA0263 [Clostridium perfringens]TBX14316.1 hypothetical protein BFS06_13985 [Clostridium perfringens]